jgi:hypothetical protein
MSVVEMRKMFSRLMNLTEWHQRFEIGIGEGILKEIWWGK